ncbi:hypothetical protein UFOVP244_47 [uncultured Caudovirales phage]|uniref:Uncharacterized protein n=1 Tax=uncultured Caudovirales phage TaxID=2100421 RepID=A0A6J7X0U3_9CAUD|nr:hypothetical protein UFOVP244_47 [uncultured Caudovirales phage]
MNSALAFPKISEGEYLNLLDVNINAADVAAINPFLAVAAEIYEATNTSQAPIILAKLSQGLTLCGNLIAACAYNLNQAKTNRKKAEAVVALEDFPRHVADQKKKGNDVKATDKTMSYYVDQHPSVVESRMREDFYAALYEKLSINRNVITMAISSARSIAYSHRDVNMMSSSAISVDNK